MCDKAKTKLLRFREGKYDHYISCCHRQDVYQTNKLFCNSWDKDVAYVYILNVGFCWFIKKI